MVGIVNLYTKLFVGKSCCHKELGEKLGGEFQLTGRGNTHQHRRAFKFFEGRHIDCVILVLGGSRVLGKGKCQLFALKGDNGKKISADINALTRPAACNLYTKGACKGNNGTPVALHLVIGKCQSGLKAVIVLRTKAKACFVLFGQVCDGSHCSYCGHFLNHRCFLNYR